MTKLQKIFGTYLVPFLTGAERLVFYQAWRHCLFPAGMGIDPKAPNKGQSDIAVLAAGAGFFI
jgi:hypothetical protein